VWRRFDEPDPGEGFVTGDARSPIKDEKAKQREDCPERGEHNVLPRCFERFRRVFEADKECRQ
jgi:hypothetical protein